MELSCVSYISTWIWKKNVKSYYLRLPKHIQYSAGCPSQNNAFAVFNAEESLHLQLGATWRWKKNIFNWSWGRRSLLKDCTVKDQPLIMIVFMRSIQRLWVLRELLTRDKDLMQNLFQTLCLDQFWKEERYGVVICNLVGSKKCKLRSAPLVQSYYVSGGKQTAMLGRVTLLYQELSFNFYSVPVPVA